MGKEAAQNGEEGSPHANDAGRLLSERETEPKDVRKGKNYSLLASL